MTPACAGSPGPDALQALADCRFPAHENDLQVSSFPRDGQRPFNNFGGRIVAAHRVHRDFQRHNLLFGISSFFDGYGLFAVVKAAVRAGMVVKPEVLLLAAGAVALHHFGRGQLVMGAALARPLV